MRRLSQPAACLAACWAMMGCQAPRAVVATDRTQPEAIAASGAQAAAGPHATQAATPCSPPWGAGPFARLDVPVSTQPVAAPARAVAEQVNGCGGVRFRIALDGTPQDVEVLADAPSGYGFGDHVRRVILATRWSGGDDPSWHYVDYKVVVPRR